MKEISNAIPAHLMAEAQQPDAKAKNKLGKDDFMMLLMTQLKHQDPMKPVDHHEFANQLAQFGSLEQLTNIGTSIKELGSHQEDELKVKVLGMLGRKVVASGSEVMVSEGNPVDLNFTKKEGVQPVKVSIFDGNSKLVREMDVGGRKAVDKIQWDGKATDGKSVPSGTYSFRVHGVDREGRGVELNSEVSGIVSGIEMDGKAPKLVLQTESGKNIIDPSRIQSVSIQEEKKEAPKDKSPEVSGQANLSVPINNFKDEAFPDSARGMPSVMPMESIRS